jgi:hypothetical protein
MRKLRWFIALCAVAMLLVAALFAINSFAGKPDEPKERPELPARNVSLEECIAKATASFSESASKLPITRVVLFNSGVGYFERQGEVEGDTRIDLSFPVQDINDMLKSMVVQDLNGGHVSAISFDSQAPVEKTLHSFAIDLSGNPSLAQILDQARGERVEVVLQQSSATQSGTLNGAIIGLELKPEVFDKNDKDRCTVVALLNLWCTEGIRAVKLADVQRLRFLNPVMESEFKKALDVIAQSHDKEKKAVSLNFTGNGQRTVKVGYVVENPIWKTSYRLVLNKGKAPFLQGWAVVENNTDEDWNSVAMNLVSGRPISFQMDLYQPLNVSRPTVEPELFASLRPPTYQNAVPFLTGTSQVSNGTITNTIARDPAIGAAFGMAAQATPQAPPLGDLPYRGISRGNEQFNQQLLTEVDLQKGVSSAANAQNLGDFYSYEIDHSITLGRQKSAMLPIVNHAVEASRVSIYNEKVHAKFPLLGLKFKNNTELHLNQGPITVFDGSNYAGDARILDLQPKEERLISYAIDLGTEVVPVAASDNGKRTAVKIVKGVVHTTTKTRETRTYTITNRSELDRTVLIEHPFRSQFHLVNTDKPSETASDVYRFAVKVEKGKTAKQVVTEERDDGEQIAISNSNDGQIRIIVNDPAASKEIKEALNKALKLKWDLVKTLEDLQHAQREIDRIKNEQPRLRENLKAIPLTDPLAKKILEKLQQQEAAIDQYEAAIQKLNTTADSQRKDFETYLSGLSVE